MTTPLVTVSMPVESLRAAVDCLTEGRQRLWVNAADLDAHLDATEALTNALHDHERATAPASAAVVLDGVTYGATLHSDDSVVLTVGGDIVATALWDNGVGLVNIGDGWPADDVLDALTAGLTVAIARRAVVLARVIGIR